MYRILLASLFFLGLGSCNNSGSDKEGSKTVVSKHSAAFNSSVRSALDTYRTITESFVNWDSATVASEAKQLDSKLSTIRLDEFKPEVKQTAENSLGLAERDLKVMALNNNITEKRHGLNSLTQNMYDFLRAVQYDEKKVYLQLCPMAFNESDPNGLWLSEKDTIRNPYFGLHHPHYGKAMLECGSIKSTIDFTSKQK